MTIGEIELLLELSVYRRYRVESRIGEIKLPQHKIVKTELNNHSQWLTYSWWYSVYSKYRGEQLYQKGQEVQSDR